MGLIKDIFYRFSSKKMISLFKEETIFPYYHLVNNENVVHIKNLYPFKNVETFKTDLDFLLKNFKSLDPKNIFRKIPKNSFLLSFDDGLEEIYSIIYPILKQKNVKAIFFLNPDFIDNQNTLYKHDISIVIEYLKKTNFDKLEIKQICSVLKIKYTSEKQFIQELKNTKFEGKQNLKAILKFLNIDIEKYLKTQKPYVSKSQIAEMIEDGFYFGGHTMSHPQLNQLTFHEQKKQIIDSIEWLKINFNLDYSFFAFPFTDKNISKKLINELFDYDENLILFGNQGLKKDFNKRIIQRFSLENPNKSIGKQIVTEHLYKLFNQLTGKYSIKRND